MTAISVMERKKEKSVYRKLLLSDSCCQTNGTSLITPSSSSSGERKSLGKVSAHPPPPCCFSHGIHTQGNSPSHSDGFMCFLGQAEVFFCFNSQLGKASEVTLEKCMHQRKKLWKGVGGSVGVLVCFMFGDFFFPLQNVFPNFH